MNNSSGVAEINAIDKLVHEKFDFLLRYSFWSILFDKCLQVVVNIFKDDFQFFSLIIVEYIFETL